jgi:hypothetical protein
MLRFCGSLWFLNNFEPVFVHLDLIRHEASKEYYVAGRFLMVTAVMIGLLWLSMVVPPLLDGSPAGNGLLDGNGSAGVLTLLMTALLAKLVAMALAGVSVVPAIFIIPLIALSAGILGVGMLRKIKKRKQGGHLWHGFLPSPAWNRMFSLGCWYG